MVISVAATGVVEAMHRDTFPLGFLGKQSVQRASEIVFDEDSQLWDLRIRVGSEFVPVNEARGFESYETARSVEVRWLELARLHGISPTSPDGVHILCMIRAAS